MCALHFVAAISDTVKGMTPLLGMHEAIIHHLIAAEGHLDGEGRQAGVPARPVQAPQPPSRRERKPAWGIE